jgi:hypothetical protein
MVPRCAVEIGKVHLLLAALLGVYGPLARMRTQIVYKSGWGG